MKKSVAGFKFDFGTQKRLKEDGYGSPVEGFVQVQHIGFETRVFYGGKKCRVETNIQGSRPPFVSDQYRGGVDSSLGQNFFLGIFDVCGREA